MFKNRALQVKMVKTDAPTPIAPTVELDGIIERSITQVTDCTKDVILFTAKIGAGYIALDTVRKVAITLAANK